MSDAEIKVTDKRMFTPDGRLREEFQFLEERLEEKGREAADAPGEAGAGEPDAASPDGAPQSDAPQSDALQSDAPHSSVPRDAAPHGMDAAPAAPGRAPVAGAAGRAEGPVLELPDLGPDTGHSPQFLDLVAMLAEPASVYMGDVEMPGAGSVEDLQMARLHIDLLGVLRQRTAGNLSAQESAFLDNVLYQLRSRYIQKRG